MRIAFISDVHANHPALMLVLRAIDDAAVDRIICLGDIVGFHTSPSLCIEVLRDRGIECLMGNHDAGVVGKLREEHFPKECWESVLWTRSAISESDRKFLLALPTHRKVDATMWLMHGLFGNPRRYLVGNLMRNLVRWRLRLAGIPLGFFGHTHRQEVHVFQNSARRSDEMTMAGLYMLDPGATYLVNPGVVGQPRNQDSAAQYAILDLEKRTLLLQSIPYDYASVVKKTLEVFPTHRRMYERFSRSRE